MTFYSRNIQLESLQTFFPFYPPELLSPESGFQQLEVAVTSMSRRSSLDGALDVLGIRELTVPGLVQAATRNLFLEAPRCLLSPRGERLCLSRSLGESHPSAERGSWYPVHIQL